MVEVQGKMLWSLSREVGRRYCREQLMPVLFLHRHRGLIELLYLLILLTEQADQLGLYQHQ